jgi:major membrane immunogen (membrane-anchored lipoprotein)
MDLAALCRLPRGDSVVKSLNIISFIVILTLAALFFYSSAANDRRGTLRDGYYTAEAEGFHYGWKEYLTIYVNKDKIVMAEYNARNATGFIKSWDMEYMRLMSASDGNYPNKYTRTYALALLDHQDSEEIEALSGATESHDSFRLLAAAAIEQAKTGDKKIAFVKVPHENEEHR